MTRRLRTGRKDEDGFALVLSLLLIMVVAGLSLAMAAAVLDQARPVQQARKLVQTVNAAQSGLQVALSTVRAANDGASNGVISRLPCTSGTGASFSSGGSSPTVSVPGTSLAGAVTAAGGAGTPTYRVSVAYYRFDPSGKDAAWLGDPANVLACPLSEVPAYAYLQSYGAGAQVAASTPTRGNRNQVATYTFSRTNVNKLGGRIRSYGTQQCLDAGSAPAVGTTLTLQPCLALGTARQTWQYRTDLTIFYGGDTSLNLCIQSPASGSRPTLQTCTGSGAGSTYPYAPGQQVQEWGFNDNGHFSAALDNGTVTNDTGGACLEPDGASPTAAAASGAGLVIAGCDYSADGPTAFDPDPQVGAGKAGGGITGVPGPTSQYVSYAQFGRCLDITSQDVNTDHLIAYPCKQAPDSAQLTFNQVWTYSSDSTGYGAFFVTKNGTRYCLTAPASGRLITTTACDSSLPSNQLWRAAGTVAGDYASSYTLVSRSTGTCMAVSPLSESLGFGASSIIVATCDGSSAQKWNAPPVDPTSRLGNIREPAGG